MMQSPGASLPVIMPRMHATKWKRADKKRITRRRKLRLKLTVGVMLLRIMAGKTACTRQAGLVRCQLQHSRPKLPGTSALHVTSQCRLLDVFSLVPQNKVSAFELNSFLLPATQTPVP